MEDDQPGSVQHAEGDAERQENLFARLRDRLKAGRELLGRLRPGREIARGGQGEVFEVWDQDFRRTLAMKVIKEPGGSPGSEYETKKRDRFIGEAQITGQLDHPGIVPVHELGLSEEDRLYFTMKLVNGRELSEIFTLVVEGDAEWSVTRTVGVLLKVCDAMTYAHEKKGVIHRDLKPANIMVGHYGEVYVMDWGLAHVVDADKSSDRFVRTDRADQAAASDESPLTTMDGDVIGTPGYMSPEQARGQIGAIGPLTDVYAVGAMLFHLLTGRMPFVDEGEFPMTLRVIQRVAAGEDPGLQALAPNASPELVAICQKAMASEPGERYADMRALAHDLRAHLENRVVQAYESGVIAELKKNLKRHGKLVTALGMAAGFFLLGLTLSVVFYTRSETQRENVLRLSAAQNLDDLVSEAALLWPPLPVRVEQYEDWLARARELVAGLQPEAESVGHYRQLQVLLDESFLLDASDQRVLAHPRWDELELLKSRVACLERAQAIRTGRAAAEVPELDEATRELDWESANNHAWALIRPEREYFGSEARALTLARHAHATAPDTDRHETADTLAWALFANGLDEDALEHARYAREIAPAQQRDAAIASYRMLAAAIDLVRADDWSELDDLRRERDALAADMRRAFRDTETRWWYEKLGELVKSLEAFADPESGLVSGVSLEYGWGVERRLEFAGICKEVTIEGPRARRLWQWAVESISDRVECPLYDGLVIDPQMGLLPIGRNGETGLWEFLHVLSAEDPEAVAALVEVGELTMTSSMGILMVLIPGGSFAMGSPRTDPLAGENEFPRKEVTLDPFFISKYEMTRAQWKRVATADPSFFDIARLELSKPLLPVERVTWIDCKEMLWRLDLELPTEAQWEAAARAGTETRWYLGDLESTAEQGTLDAIGNIADRTVIDRGVEWPEAFAGERLGWDDGYFGTSPVGSFEPNPYGLYDVVGNVEEWCRDRFADYTFENRPGDGEHVGFGRPDRIIRGGAMNGALESQRPANRDTALPESSSWNRGVRPTRALR